MSSNIIVLGIESTAHTFGCGIVDEKGNILADVRGEYTPVKGGIHPREASQYFTSIAHTIIRKALSEAKVTMKNIDAIAVALGPGLGPCLRTGATIARALASYFNKPLIPVNHAVAHIEIGKLLTGAKDPLVIYVSGGNTLITAYAKGRYRIFGETLDLALGNTLDVFAREAGIAPPYIIEGYHVVDYYANKGKNILDLPYIVKGQDVSFSGLLTAALRLLREGYPLEDVCLSFRENAYNMVVEVAERGLAHTGKKEILLVGGVAASPILRSKVETMAKYYNVKVYLTPPKYSLDNGVMIAWTGLLAYKHGVTIPIDESYVKQRWRIDEVDIPWMEE